MMKRQYLSGVAAFALVAGMSASASAFDYVRWTWDKDIVENVTIDINIDENFNPTGMTEVESLQLMGGDQEASATASGNLNIPVYPTEATGVATVDLGSFTFEGSTDDVAGNDPFDPSSVVINTSGGPDDLDPQFTGGEVTGQNGGLGDGETVTAEFDLGEIDVDASEIEFEEGALNARFQLPTVEASATAFSNFQTVESDTATFVHAGQIAHGDFSEDGESSVGFFDALAVGGTFDSLSGDISNTHLASAYGVWVAGALGVVEPATVSADASAILNLNAQTSASATAFANNHSTSIEADGGDRFLAQDLVQMGYANVSADATNLANVVYHYDNLGQIEGNLHEAVATAAGNMSTISVKAPTIDVE